MMDDHPCFPPCLIITIQNGKNEKRQSCCLKISNIRPIPPSYPLSKSLTLCSDDDVCLHKKQQKAMESLLAGARAEAKSRLKIGKRKLILFKLILLKQILLKSKKKTYSFRQRTRAVANSRLKMEEEKKKTDTWIMWPPTEH